MQDNIVQKTFCNKNVWSIKVTFNQSVNLCLEYDWSSEFTKKSVLRIGVQFYHFCWLHHLAHLTIPRQWSIAAGLFQIITANCSTMCRYCWRNAVSNRKRVLKHSWQVEFCWVCLSQGAVIGALCGRISDWILPNEILTAAGNIQLFLFDDQIYNQSFYIWGF